jgi:hypothetical protein
VIRILPPRPAEGRQLGRRVARSLPDLALGALFGAAWLNLLGLGARYGVSLMLLIEVEGWILIVTFFSAALAYGVASEQHWGEKAKLLVALVLLCAAPPVYFAVRWRLWWPVGAYAGLLWNRWRVARGAVPQAKRLRVPLREIVLYAGAVAASLLLAIPPLGAGAAHFQIGVFPGWCHIPDVILPNDLLRDPHAVPWCTEPHRALVAGGAYYLTSGLLTLKRGPYRLSLLFGWVRRDEED